MLVGDQIIIQQHEDWFMVAATIALGVIALVVPWFSELVKRTFFGPKLVAVFREGNPYNHKTHTADPIVPLYYFRFGVKNEGSGSAENVEVEVESVKKTDASKRFNSVTTWAPAGLKWSARPDERVTILPGQTAIADFFRVAQRPRQPDSSVLRVEVQRELFAQSPELAPADYELVLAIYCSNAAPVRYTVKLSFAGVWHEQEQEMFAACVVTPERRDTTAITIAGIVLKTLKAG